jgi:hypothetical protein
MMRESLPQKFKAGESSAPVGFAEGLPSSILRRKAFANPQGIMSRGCRTGRTARAPIDRKVDIKEAHLLILPQ